jgi:hypothetical protein
MAEKIPKSFKNLEEEAAFWAAHSLSELFDETEESDHIFVQKKKAVLSFKFDKDLVEAVTRASQKLGINRSALIQMLLKKGLNDFRKEGWL